MMINRFILAAFSATLAVSGISAGEPLLKVTDASVDPRSSEIVMMLDVDTRHIKPGRDREVIFRPVLRAIGAPDSVLLPAFTVSGRNRYYSHLRNGDLADGEQVVMAGSSTPLRYYITTPRQPWMTRSRIDVLQSVAHCCDSPVPDGVNPVAELDLGRRTLNLPFEYVALLGDSVITHTAEGRAFVNFVVNRTELKPDYMENPREIAKIIATIDVVKNDPEAVISEITIKGYASPEGSYSNNVRLAMGRTQTLKEYVRKHYSFDNSIMRTDYEPEDWQGLRDWLVGNDIAHRDEILKIVDSNLEPDPKNAEIERRFPEQYDYIHKNVYPWLRHSDYTVKYTFKTYDDIETLKRIFNENPERLRAIDFQRIASTYPVGSKEYDQVMMTAVRVWPNDEMANLNAANISMARNDLKAAANYLVKAGATPEAVYSRGVLAARNGDLDSALQLMERARELGVKQSESAIKAIQAEIDRPYVTYFIGPKAK